MDELQLLEAFGGPPRRCWSLFRIAVSLICGENFPVIEPPPSGLSGCNQARNVDWLSRDSRNFAGFPCKFPVKQGFRSETGSL